MGPPYGERKNREKMVFLLGGTQEEGKSKILPPSRRHEESTCKSKEKGSHTRKKEEERAAKREPLREKKIAKRELCLEKKIERRKQSVAAFERDNLCV